MLSADLENKLSNFWMEVNFVQRNADFPWMRHLCLWINKTIDERGKKTIKVRTTKSEKCCITAVLSCSATGVMLPPMIIFRGTTERSIRGVSSKDTIISCQKKAWVDEIQMLKWIKKVWLKYTRGNPSLLAL